MVLKGPALQDRKGKEVVLPLLQLVACYLAAGSSGISRNMEMTVLTRMALSFRVVPSKRSIDNKAGCHSNGS